MGLILVVEDERLLRWALRRQIEFQGHTVHEAANLAEAEAHLRAHRPDVVVLDIALPDGNGLDFLAAQKEALAESVVYVMTAAGQIEDAVRAMKLGAADFLCKPLEYPQVCALIEKGLEAQRDRIDVERSRREAEQSHPRHAVIAESAVMRALLEEAATVAASPATTVLILGETGTGKEVLAQFIHSRSSRANHPRVVLNCAALPSELIESELFGHEKGAFTDAKATRRGVFELAHQGTLIFDEIGELQLGLQAKLLRCLEERTIRRVGGAREINVDTRIIALTNRNLAEAAAKGEFRSDLYFRLSVFPLEIPPLRARKDDVLPLALHFLKRFGASFGKTFDGVSPDFASRLRQYDWPGNVRELRNLMERTAILEPSGTATGKTAALAPGSQPPGAAPAPDLTSEETILPLEDVEFLMVQRAMKAANGKQSGAARLLGITRDQLRYRIVRYRSEGRWQETEEEAVHD